MESDLFFLSSSLIFLLGLLFLSEGWLHLDDLSGMNGSELRNISTLLNGDPALLGTVIYGHSIVPRQTTERTLCAGRMISTNGVMAVVIMEAMSLPDGIVPGIFTERLLHGLRIALLTGAPWLIIPSYGIMRRNVEDLLWHLKPPGDALFPDEVVEKLPLDAQGLARKLRESMSSESSFRDWMNRGHVIDRLVLNNSVNQSLDELPRLIRYGKNEWIVPGILWADPLDAQMSTLSMMERMTQIIMHNIQDVRAKEQIKAEETPWLQEDCFDLVVVSSGYNELYAKVLFSKELQRMWGFQRTHVQSNSPEQLVECVRVLAAPSEDAVPVWSPPTPSLVHFSSTEAFNPASSYLARLLGIYAHTLYVNYKRWHTSIMAYLLGYKPISFFNEIVTILGALLTETVMIQDIVRFGLGIC